MSTHIKVLIGFVILALIAMGIIVYEVHRKDSAPQVPATPITKDETTPAALSLKQQSWDVFQEYLASLKAHDMTKFKARAYQISEVCSDSAYQARCFGLMDSAYAAGSPLKLSDFTHIISDDKQVIMYSDYSLEHTANATGYWRELLYLARGTDGNLKLLSFEPHYGYYEVTGTSTPAQITADLNKLIIDTDNDTLTDQVETCSYEGVDLKICKKTDPTKRDTDGNGWWDPIQKLFYTNTPK